MRRVGLGLLALALAGCATGGSAPVSEATVALRAAQEQACKVAVAKHVGKGVDAVMAAWTGLTKDGTAIVTVSDEDPRATSGERVHTCEVDENAQVLAILHPHPGT